MSKDGPDVQAAALNVAAKNYLDICKLPGESSDRPLEDSAAAASAGSALRKEAFDVFENRPNAIAVGKELEQLVKQESWSKNPYVHFDVSAGDLTGLTFVKTNIFHGEGGAYVDFTKPINGPLQIRTNCRDSDILLDGR